MPSAYLQWRFHSGERVVAHGPLVFFFVLFFFFFKKIGFDISYELSPNFHKMSKPILWEK